MKTYIFCVIKQAYGNSRGYIKKEGIFSGDHARV